jgi:hypothetical protein
VRTILVKDRFQRGKSITDVGWGENARAVGADHSDKRNWGLSDIDGNQGIRVARRDE